SILKHAYAAADLFVMPNIPVQGDMEGFGIVLLEANMANTPAVAADLEGIRGVIGQGKNGYRGPSRNVKEFADKIDELTNGINSECSDGASSYVKKHFEWDYDAVQYVEYLEDGIRENAYHYIIFVIN